MQTFLTCNIPSQTAKILDVKRLGKQRVETCQILNSLLNLTSTKGWRNHPAVKMWKGYESYLCRVYLHEMIEEWLSRGYKSPKVIEHYNRYCSILPVEIIEPEWFSEEFFKSHQSNLVRKFPEHYKKYFPDVESDLPYVWPV